MPRMKIEFRDGTHFLIGSLDESFQGAAISMGATVTRLDLAGVSSHNSVGIAQFVDFVNGWAGRKIEYLRCAADLVDTLITIPSMLGPNGSVARIRSIQAFYGCAECGQTETVVVADADMTLVDDEVHLPVRSCPGCRCRLDLQIPALPLVELVTCGALDIERTGDDANAR